MTIAQINTSLDTIGNITIPEPDGTRASVPVTCLAGDPGNNSPFGDDSLCQPGFQSFPGGMNQFAQYQGFGHHPATGDDHQRKLQRLPDRCSHAEPLGSERRSRLHVVARNRHHHQDINCRVSNPWNLKYDKGSGVLDRRHILSTNYVYKLPFFTKSTGLLHALARRLGDRRNLHR